MNTGKNIFHKANKNSKEQKRALVDIDETICFYSNERRYDLSEPNYKNIDKINKLYDEGWEIIYWTARGSVSGVDYREHTLITGTGSNPKPMFDLVIDDKAKRIEEL